MYLSLIKLSLAKVEYCDKYLQNSSTLYINTIASLIFRQKKTTSLYQQSFEYTNPCYFVSNLSPEIPGDVISLASKIISNSSAVNIPLSIQISLTDFPEAKASFAT